MKRWEFPPEAPEVGEVDKMMADLGWHLAFDDESYNQLWFREVGSGFNQYVLSIGNTEDMSIMLYTEHIDVAMRVLRDASTVALNADRLYDAKEARKLGDR